MVQSNTDKVDNLEQEYEQFFEELEKKKDDNNGFMMIAEMFEDFVLSPLSIFIYLFIGGYGSGKSVAIAYKLIMECLDKKTSVMVLRKSFTSHEKTTFKLLSKLIRSVCPGALARPLNTSTSTIYFKNGSEIIFMGLQDPERLKSLEGVEIAWIEEGSEIEKADFTEIIGRLRQKRIHIILSSNPLTEMNWLFQYFFIRQNPDGSETTILHPEKFYGVPGQEFNGVYYHHSTAKDNPFVSLAYKLSLQEYEVTDPFKYVVAWRGEFGVLGTRVFHNWEIIGDKEEREIPGNAQTRCGMDFGFVTSYDGALLTRRQGNTIWILREFYKKGQDDLDKLSRELKETLMTSTTIFADNQEARLITMLQGAGRQYGLSITGCRKGQESVKEGYRKLKAFKIKVHKRCKHTIKTMKSLAHKEVNGIIIEDEFNFDPHLMDALRYAYSYDVFVDVTKGDNYGKHIDYYGQYQTKSNARRK